MIKNIVGSIAASTRALFSRWPALLVMIALYLAMLAAVYIFFTTREATVGQLVVNLLAPLAAIVLFFVLQAMAARFSIEQRAGGLLLSSLKSIGAMLAVTIPIVLLIWLILYLAGDIQESVKPAVQQAARAVPGRIKNVARPQQPVPWPVVVTTTIEYVLLLLALPLLAIQNWISAGRHGLAVATKSTWRNVVYAFAPSSVITYLAGFLVFAVAPYLLLSSTTHASNAWVEAGLFGLRLLAGSLLVLIGWVVTVGALARLRETAAPASELGEGTEHAPASA
jgi:hypothetical protein